MKTLHQLFVLLYLCCSSKVLCLQELPLVISVCSYNVAPWVEKNLDSIFMQHYDNFHVIYLNDGSTDDTQYKVQQYITTHQLHDRITLINNPSRCRKMKNIYNVFHQCDDQAIIVQVDGDDWLAHDRVFATINETYQQGNVWLTYGQFQQYPSEKMGYCRPVPPDIIEKRAFRSYNWIYTHVRTFYAWLFKCIKLEDVLCECVPGFEGMFFPVANDGATYYPMLEMCGPNFAFIPDVLYIHNRSNPLYGRSTDLDLYSFTRPDIRSRTKYPQLCKPALQRLAPFKTAQADIVVLSCNRPAQLEQLLLSLEHNITNVATIIVCYEASTQEIHAQYQKLHDQYPDTHFVIADKHRVYELVSTLIKDTPHQHVLITKDTVYVEKELDIRSCIMHLEKTGAYGFYLNFCHQAEPFNAINEKDIPHQHIWEDIYAWKFNCGRFALFNNIDLTLLRKKDLLNRLESIANTTINSLSDLLHSWQKNPTINGHMVGLFFDKPKLGGSRTQITTPFHQSPIKETYSLKRKRRHFNRKKRKQRRKKRKQKAHNNK